MTSQFAQGTDRPVAAQYVVTFLKPEMLHVYRQIQGLEAFRPVVICQKRENAAQFPCPDVRCLPKPRTHQLRRFWQKTLWRQPVTIYPSEARCIESTLLQAKAAVLHIYFGHIGVHLLPLIARRRFPVVVSFHGADAGVDLDRPAHARLMRQMLEKVDLVLVRSESLARSVAACGALPEKIRLHRTGIPLGEIEFTPRTPPPADGAWRVVQASRLIAKKGLRTTLRAFAEFGRRFPRATLTIAGEGPMEAELRQAAAELGLSERVQFTGFLGQEELRRLYAASHLFLHPSETGEDGDQEGVPNAMLEAMASGLPALATRHGGIPEAIRHGLDGLLVGERDAEGLVAQMFAVADDPALYAALAHGGAEAVRSKFDLTAQTAVLEQCYREAIARKGSA